ATELDQRVAPASWCFTPTRDFGTTRIQASVLPPSRNVTLVSATQNVTRYEAINSRPAERGLNLEVLERATGRTFPRYRIVDSGSPSSKEAIHGQAIEVYRPPATETRNRTPRPVPQEQRMPSRAMIQRLDVEQHQFEQRMQQERTALAHEQERELNQHGRSSVPSEEMRQRHQAETRMQQDREDRERRALDRRRQIIQEMQNGHVQDKDKGQPEQGQGKSQDKGRG